MCLNQCATQNSYIILYSVIHVVILSNKYMYMSTMHACSFNQPTASVSNHYRMMHVCGSIY